MLRDDVRGSGIVTPDSRGLVEYRWLLPIELISYTQALVKISAAEVMYESYFVPGHSASLVIDSEDQAFVEGVMGWPL
jgi:hypothetical protein